MNQRYLDDCEAFAELYIMKLAPTKKDTK